MVDSVDCPRCHTPMEPGFIADRTYGGVGGREVGSWAAGASLVGHGETRGSCPRDYDAVSAMRRA
jgi:hypothetical protein